MEWLIVIVLVVAFLWWRQTSKAKRVVRSRAADLALVTGKPASQIEQEMIQRKITPGQWAGEHGLDPMTFQPLGQARPEGTDVLGRPFGTLDEMQAGVDETMTAKQIRLEEVKQQLAASDDSGATDEDERGRLEEERKQLETFLWLARGGDRKGEAPPV